MQDNGFVSASLFINEEQMPGKGEDSALGVILPNAALIACMDGCGGAGAYQYASAGNASGARISAEYTGTAIRKWFLEKQYGYSGLGARTPESIAAELKEAICRELQQVRLQLGEKASGVKSRLARELPATLAAVLSEVTADNRLRCISLWAGDSRTYLFSSSGLRQTSRDDVHGCGDPFDVLINDGKLSNLVSADCNFEIHAREDVMTEPGMIITATDGCFAYYVSPLQFEWILLETLAESASPLDWENRLRASVGGYAADDYTMCIAVVGYQDWDAVRRAYSVRKAEMERDYLIELQHVLETGNQDAHREIWLRYKAHYMK